MNTTGGNVLTHLTLKIIKSTQYKKLVPNASHVVYTLHIKIWNLAKHMKIQNRKHQNGRIIGEKLKTKSLMFFVSFFFHVIARFQIGANYLYWIDFTNHHIKTSNIWHSTFCQFFSVLPVAASNQGQPTKNTENSEKKCSAMYSNSVLGTYIV